MWRRLVGMAVFLVAAASSLAVPLAQRAVARPGPKATVLWKIAQPGWGRADADGAMAFFLTDRHDVVGVDAADGNIRWTQRTTDVDPSIGTGVVLAGGTLLAGDYNLHAYVRTSGALRWRFVPSTGFAPGVFLGSATPTVAFAGSGSGDLYAIDLATGLARWTAVVSPFTTSVFEPVFDGDTVFAGYTTFSAPTSGGVIALDAENGEEKWRASLHAPAGSTLGAGAAGPVVVAGDVVIASNRAGSIDAFSRVDGVPLWSIPALNLPLFPNAPVPELPGPKPDIRALAVSGSTLFAGSSVGYTIAYDLSTRRERWRHMGLQNGSIAVRITADEQCVYVPSFAGRVTAIDVRSGSERWQFGDYLNRAVWPPAVVGDLAYVSAFGGLFQLKR